MLEITEMAFAASSSVVERFARGDRNDHVRGIRSFFGDGEERLNGWYLYSSLCHEGVLDKGLACIIVTLESLFLVPINMISIIFEIVSREQFDINGNH
jgi:hypothetical protein